MISGTNPACPLIWRTVPAPRHPLIATPLRRPVATNPCVSRTRKRTRTFVTDPRGWMSDIHRNLCRGGDAECGREHYATYPIPFHFVSPLVCCGETWKDSPASWCLRCGVLLASGLDPGQNSNPHQDQSAHHNPVGWYVHQAGAVDEPGNHDHKTGQVNSK